MTLSVMFMLGWVNIRLTVLEMSRIFVTYLGCDLDVLTPKVDRFVPRGRGPLVSVCS